MANPKTSEKSNYLDREEHLSKGAVAAKKVVLYTYDSGTDTLNPLASTSTYGIQAISDDGTYKYFFFEDKDANYYVMRKHLANKVFDYATGTGGYSSCYVDPTSAPSDGGALTYNDYGDAF